MKTEQTKKLEHAIWQATYKMGVYGCFEVTIGINGKERVDYMTYDSKGVFRCYEIKVTKTDFHSPCKASFVGHYNYYVLPEELYEELKDEIPQDVGVYAERKGFVFSAKMAKRQKDVNTDMLKDSLIRSLSRESVKVMHSDSVPYMESLKREVTQAERERNRAREDYWNLLHEVQELYGYHWRHPEKKREEKTDDYF